MLDHRMGYAVLGWSKSGRVAAGSSSCGQQGTLQQGIWCRGDRRFHGVRRTGSRWSWLLPGGFRGSHGLWDWRQLLPSGCHQLGPGVRSRWKVWRVRKHQELTPLDQQCNSEYLKRHWANRAIQQIVKVAFSGGKIHYIWHTKNVTANKNRCWGNWLYVLCYPPKDRSLWRPWWAPPISIDLHRACDHVHQPGGQGWSISFSLQPHQKYYITHQLVWRTNGLLTLKFKAYILSSQGKSRDAFAGT